VVSATGNAPPCHVTDNRRCPLLDGNKRRFPRHEAVPFRDGDDLGRGIVARRACSEPRRAADGISSSSGFVHALRASPAFGQRRMFLAHCHIEADRTNESADNRTVDGRRRTRRTVLDWMLALGLLRSR
jgi:hypothetical protein